MPEPEPDRLLRARELAPLLGVSISTIYYWKRYHGLPSVKLGVKTRRFRFRDVRRWIKKSGDKKPSPANAKQ